MTRRGLSSQPRGEANCCVADKLKRPIISMASAKSSSERSRSLKGKYGLANCPFANTLLQGVCRSKVHRHAEQIGEAIFQPNTVQQREFATAVEFRHQIDVRLSGRVPRATEPNNASRVTPAAFSSVRAHGVLR